MKECAKAAAAPWKDSPSYLFINPLYVVLFVARKIHRIERENWDLEESSRGRVWIVVGAEGVEESCEIDWVF